MLAAGPGPADEPSYPEHTLAPINIDQSADHRALSETETAFTDFTYKLKHEDVQVPMRGPSVWLRGDERRSGLTHTAQLLSMRISSFTPLRCSASESSAAPYGMSLLLPDVLPQPDLTLVGVRQWRRSPLASHRQEPWTYGLARHAGHSGELRQDVFMIGAPELSDTSVHCGRKREGIRKPQCSTFFSVGHADAKLGFSRAELPKWGVIKDPAERFLTPALEAA